MFKQHIPYPNPFCTKAFKRVEVYVDRKIVAKFLATLAGAGW